VSGSFFGLLPSKMVLTPFLSTFSFPDTFSFLFFPQAQIWPMRVARWITNEH